MRLAFQFRQLVFAQVLLGIVAFCIAERNPGMLLVAGALTVLSRYVTEGPLGRTLPRWLINSFALIAVVWLMLDLYWQQGNVIVAMGHFIMWLQVLLLYTQKSNREYGQLLVLSVMQMVGASILSVSMIYGGLLTAYCILGLLTVVQFHLKTTWDRVDDQNRAAAPRTATVSRSGQVTCRGFRWQLRCMVGAIGLVCTSVAIAVFVITPRSEEARFSNEATRPMTRSEVGFSNQMRLDSSPLPEGSKEPVLNLKVTRRGRNVGNDQVPFLLRGASLDQYHPGNHVWSRGVETAGRDRTLIVGDTGVALAALPPDTVTTEAQITLRQSNLSTLFTLFPATGFASEHVSKLVFNPEDQQLSTRRPVTGAIIYGVTKPDRPPADLEQRYRARHRQTGRRPSRAKQWSDSNYARSWPVQTQRFADYAIRQLKEHGLDRDRDARFDPRDQRIASILAEHLRDDFRYTLDNPIARDEKPIVAFLFNHRRGHCELFASALAALTRSIGMQSRVVNGYRASEFNRIGGYYVVRRSNAHAWTEVNCGPGIGWKTFDATPPAAVHAEHSVERTVLSSIREIYEHLEFEWIRAFVAYDESARTALLSRINQSIDTAARDRQTWLGTVIAFARELPHIWRADTLSYTIAGIIVIVIGIAFASLARSLVVRRRRLASLRLSTLPRQHRRGLAARLRFYLTMLEMLERQGHTRPAWQTPFDFARQLASADPTRFNPVVALTETFYEIRFGRRPLDEGRRQQIRTSLRQLESSLGR